MIARERWRAALGSATLLAGAAILGFWILCALLGARITAGQIFALGWAPFFIVLVGMATTIGLGVWAARAFRLTPTFGALSGWAVEICGASAALATRSPSRSAATLRSPAHSTTTGSSLSTNTSDLTIWPSSQPTAAAASAAVRA